MKPWIFTVALFASASVPLQAADVQIVAQNPVVELSVYEEVEAKPDTVTISAGVLTDAPTAVAAMRQNSAEMERVIARIKAAGIAERDIQTTGLNLNARFEYERDGERQVFRGYRAINTVSVRFRDVRSVGPILDALVAAGANNINGPSFSIENDEAFKATARRNALQRAQRQALEYARAAGYANVRLLQVSEGIEGRTRPESEAIIVTGSRVGGAPPVEPGVIGTGVTIAVTYEMVR
jgi:uncharacterized protein YggE